MADQNQQPAAAPKTPEFLLDDSDLLTAEDQAALESEQQPEAPEPPPEGLPAKHPDAPAPQQADAAPPKKEPPKTIPYNRFKEVNDKAKQLETELNQERERRARLDERVQMAREAEERARQQQAPIEVPSKLGPRPDPSLDPIGADLWDNRREVEILRFERDQDRQAIGQTSQQIQQTRQQQEFANWVDNDARSFRAQHPDYDAAADHAYKFRVRWWTNRGVPEVAAKQIVDQEAVAAAMLSRQNQKSAAEGFYELAKEVGYNGNGTQPITPTGLPGQPEVQPSPTQQTRERLNQVREGQKFQGLSRVPAERAENVDWSNMTAQQLADYPEDDLVQDLNDPVKGPQLRKAFQRLEMGG